MIVNGKEFIRNKTIQFNINNLEWAQYILEKCNELEFDVIIGVSESVVKYIGSYKLVVDIIKGLVKAMNININVSIHLDHGKSYESCVQAIDAGFTSVMIDGSQLLFEGNVNLTKRVVDYAKQYNVMVEGEIGKIDGGHSDPEEVLQFVSETGVDTVAIAVGTVHGVYTQEPVLAYDLIEQINKLIDTPLVMHGGSGLSKEEVQNCLRLGIDKININTELQQAWASGVRNYLLNNPDVYDPRKIITSGKELLQREVEEKINYLKEI